MTELSETLCVGPPQLLIACGADAADVDAMEADEQTMAATCQVRRQQTVLRLPPCSAGLVLCQSLNRAGWVTLLKARQGPVTPQQGPACFQTRR